MASKRNIPMDDENTAETATAGQTAGESRADARNALIAAWDEINIGNHKTWKISRYDAELVWGVFRPGYEYKGFPVELDE